MRSRVPSGNIINSSRDMTLDMMIPTVDITGVGGGIGVVIFQKGGLDGFLRPLELGKDW